MGTWFTPLFRRSVPLERHRKKDTIASPRKKHTKELVTTPAALLVIHLQVAMHCKEVAYQIADGNMEIIFTCTKWSCGIHTLCRAG